MLNVALNVPTALGVNVILNVHDELAGTTAGVPQVLVCAKSFWPLQAMLLSDSGTEPAFWKVTVFAGLVVPTLWFAKVNDVGVTFTAVPSPLINSPCFTSVKLP